VGGVAVIQISRGKIVKRTWQWKGQKRVAYIFDVMVDGRRVRKQYASKQEAQDELDAFRDETKNPKPAAVEAPPVPMLAETFKKFLALKSHKKTAGEFQRVAEHLKAAFGADVPLTDITAERIAEYKATRLALRRGGKPLTAAAVNRPLGLLRTLLRQTLRWRIIVEVPEIEFEDEPAGVVRFLRSEEATRLLGACRKSRNTTLADLVEFAMFTGVRRGEALGLTWDRVDRARGVVLLTETKSGRPREVQLSANADAALARRWTPNATGLVFGSRNWNSFRQAWVAAVRAAGIAKFRFHDLRHTTASWLVQQGRSLREVKELLGHSDIQITMRYAHLAPDHLRAAVASLDGILSAGAPETAGATAGDVELRRKSGTRTSSAVSTVL
jgi:integrase